MKTVMKAARNLLHPFAPVLLFTFGVAARCCFALSKAVGWAYLRVWPVFGIYWYDHTFDHLLAPGRNKSTERGTFANRYIEPGAVVLDVACGDGSLAGDYYSREASHVDAFDYDERAIRHAKKKHGRSNINFFAADATAVDLRPEHYNVITFFAVLEHLSSGEGLDLLQKLSRSLKVDGVLIGSTLLKSETENNGVHRNRFSSVQSLKNLLSPHFDHLDLWSSRWPGRLDCYFECRLPKGRPHLAAPEEKAVSTEWAAQAQALIEAPR